MATALYVTSTETYSGKTALCIGLARRMQRDASEEDAELAAGGEAPRGRLTGCRRPGYTLFMLRT